MRARRSALSRRGRWLRAGRAAGAGTLVAVLLGCVLAAYLTWLEMQVRQRLADLQWELPARVYARPIDLYAGAALSAADLERHLRRAGYQRQESIGIPGDYARSGDRISAYLREFAYWDGVEPPRLLEVRFAGRRIISLRDTRSGEPAALQRVDPPLVGRIVPRSNENRVFVPASGIPPALRDAIVAVEDRQFFRHRGVDLRGILRALWVNLRAGEVEQGGSTLTQQLVKNLFLSPDRTLARKLNEAAMAVLVEWHLDKEQILWAYVNEVYLGQQGATAVHGFGTAAEYYFGRPLGELRLHQLALLVALVRGASHYDPHRHPERARERRDLVLRLMQDGGFLSAAEGDAASRRGLDIVGKPTWSRERHPAFMDLVRRDLRELYSVQQLASTGLRIFTSLDLDAQEAVDAGIEQVLKRIEARRKIKPGSLQAAALVIDYTTGEVVAMAGGRGAGAGDFNRALTARRPIGSLVKPFVYLEALGQGNRFNLLTPLDDSPFELKLDDGSLWKPENYDQRQHGTVTMLEALSRSYNVATVRLGMELGPVRIMKLLQRSGLRYAPKPLPSTLLGAIELSPLEVGQVYQTLANGGFSIPLSTIREAVAVNGTGLTRHELSMSQSFEPGPAFLIAHALAEATTGGTGKALPGLLGQSGHFPGKTGTTNDLRDSWFAGYGDRYLGVVWAGLDSNNSMGLTGAAGAMPVWAETMRRLGVEPWPGVPPPDVRWMRASAVPIGGACADLGYIPYIGAPVGVLSGCNGG